MQPWTMLSYLFGDRRAILAIAGDRRWLAVGAMLVLSAGLARNYDRASLLDEPWRLLGPFVASLVISGPLFLVLRGLALLKGMAGPGIGREYLAFLALYWMMAPMAWLYGIPYERSYTPVEAVHANLWTLVLVSIWRVALMSRAAAVVFGMPWFVTFPIVMLVADVAALFALYVVPLPVVQVMGGLGPVKDAVAWASLYATLLTLFSLPVWLLWAAWVANRLGSAAWQPAEMRRKGLGAWIVAVLAVAFWAAWLPSMQPAPRLAKGVERAYRDSGPAAGIALIAAHDRSEFPPDWEPPPDHFTGDPTTEEVLDALEAFADHPEPAWLGEVYSRRFRDRLRYDHFNWPYTLSERYLIRLADVLGRLPLGPEMARAYIDTHAGGPNDADAAEQDALARLEALARPATDGSP